MQYNRNHKQHQLLLKIISIHKQFFFNIQSKDIHNPNHLICQLSLGQDWDQPLDHYSEPVDMPPLSRPRLRPTTIGSGLRPRTTGSATSPSVRSNHCVAAAGRNVEIFKPLSWSINLEYSKQGAEAESETLEQCISFFFSVWATFRVNFSNSDYSKQGAEAESESLEIFLFFVSCIFFSLFYVISVEKYSRLREKLWKTVFSSGFSILANFRGNFSNIQNKVLRPREKPWRIYIFCLNVSFIVISVEKFSRLREKLWKTVSLFNLF